MNILSLFINFSMFSQLSFSQQFKELSASRSSLIDVVSNIMDLCLESEDYLPKMQHQFEELLRLLKETPQYPCDIFKNDFLDATLSMLFKSNMECSPLAALIFEFLSQFALQNKKQAKYLYENRYYEILLQYIDNYPNFLDLTIITSSFLHLSYVSSFVAYDLLRDDRISYLFSLIPSIIKEESDEEKNFGIITNILSIPRAVASKALSYDHALLLLDLLTDSYSIFVNNNFLISKINFSLIEVLQKCPIIKYMAASKFLTSGLLFQHMMSDPMVFSTSFWLLSIILENDPMRTCNFIDLDFMNSLAYPMKFCENNNYIYRRWFDFYNLLINSNSLIDIFYNSSLYQLSLTTLESGNCHDKENIILMYTHIFANHPDVEKSVFLLENDIMKDAIHSLFFSSIDNFNKMYSILVNLKIFLEKIITENIEVPQLFHTNWFNKKINSFYNQDNTFLYEAAADIKQIYDSNEIPISLENSDDELEFM